MSIAGLIKKIVKSSSDSSLVERAFEFAKEAHQSQKRASGEEYIRHPMRVAQILTEMHLDHKAITAGLLHDIPDDTEKTMEDIEKEFGKEVAFLVEGVSKLGKLRYPKNGLEIKTAQERLEEPIDLRAENLRKMFFAMAEDLRVILIKLADRLHNMETLGSLPLEKQKRIALETLEIFAPLANRLGMGEMKGKLEDLAFPYLYPREFRWLMENVREKYEEQEKYLEKVKPVFRKILEREGINPIDIHTRTKHYWSLYQKLLRYDMNLEKMHDLVALRTIVGDIKLCYKTLGIIHKLWRPLPGFIKDYIAFPKPNNYMALHTTCFCIDGKITEFQVKTEGMHEEAEYGIAAHWAYKEGVDLKTQRRKFAWVQQLRDWQKEVQKSGEFLESLKIDFFKNRIFVFTPKGDVIDLPEGATPVDFAYAVHTDIGHCCAGAKINGRIGTLSQPLQNGDVVAILVDKNKRPSRDWLEFVKTSFARSRIKHFLKTEARPENFNRGIKMLDEFLRPLRGVTFSNLPQQKKEQLLKVFPYKNLEGLIVAVGEGEISPREVLKNLIKEEEIFSRPQLRLEKPRETQTGVFLAGQTGIQMHLAKCCQPRTGEEIKAYITKSRGAAVHKVGCKNLIKAQKKWPQKIIEASWSGKEKLYAASLEIRVQDRMGLLRDVSSTISGLEINILSCQTKDRFGEKSASILADVEISGWEDLDRLFYQLKQVKGVLEIRKV